MLRPMETPTDVILGTVHDAPAARERDYERIARAIAYLRTHAAEQPDLAAAARHVNLSD